MAEDLPSTVARGDYRASLEALRDHLAVECQGAKSENVASLARQLADVLKALEALPSAKKGSKVDELSRRRAAKRTAPKRSTGVALDGAGGGRPRR